MSEARGLLKRLLQHVRRLPSMQHQGCLDMIRARLEAAKGLEGEAAAHRLQTLRETVLLLDTVELRRDYARLDSGDKYDQAEKLRRSAARAGLQLPEGIGLERDTSKSQKYEEKMSGFLENSLFRK
mmetsp:Transcript_18761/g.70991  ORF Transcript_18761/g.70991 Transcript_18761/m.70991 type:complete len:126 (+) Transcript_18761:133-510(+)